MAKEINKVSINLDTRHQAKQSSQIIIFSSESKSTGQVFFFQMRKLRHWEVT